MKQVTDDFRNVTSNSAFQLKCRAEIWRKDGESGLDELRAANLVITSMSYDEILDDGIVKGKVTVEIYDPVGSLFPYSLDAPTSPLGNRMIVFLDARNPDYMNNQVFSMKLGEFWIDGSPEGATPLPRKNLGGAFEHIGGKFKIVGVDRLSSIGKELFVKKLRALDQPAPAAITRILSDIEWSNRDVEFDTSFIASRNVKFENTTTETNYWGTVYPEDVSNSIRVVMEQLRTLAYTDQNAVVKFREKGDNAVIYQCTPQSGRIIKQTVKMDFKEIFNAIIVEDEDVTVGDDEGQEGDQTGFYMLESNPLFAYGRFARIYKKFTREEVPNKETAIAVLNEALAESGKMTIKAVLMPELECGDGIIINPRQGEATDRQGVVLELNHDFDALTTDIVVGVLLDHLVECPNLGQSYAIEGGEFNRLNL